MSNMNFTPGDLLMGSGGRLVEVRARVDRDPQYKCAGWRVLRLNTNNGDGYGFTEFLPDYLVDGYRRVVEDEWMPVLSGVLEERWTFGNRGIWYRELRKIQHGPEGVS